MTIAEFKKDICGKSAAVVGIGVSNLPLVRILADCKAKLCIYDKRTKEQLGEIYDELAGYGAEMVLGEHYLDKIKDGTDILFKTPGIRCDVPAIYEAEKNGTKITSEMELFFETCPCKIISVTGSDGKTTTTSLIYEMLVKAGYTCHLGGNIGRPLLPDVENMKPEDICVVELSSFQLHTMKQSGDIAVVTNVTPNHLDWHTDFDEYKDSKKAVFKYQNENDRVVLNYDNDITRDFRKETDNGVFFSRQACVDNGFCLEGNMIVRRKDGKTVREVLDINTIYIPGMHNVENYMAAAAAVEGLADDEVIRRTAVDFKGVPHRIEFVRELDGVKYYNDSIASSPARTTAGLKSFGDKKVILIAGGYDKKIPFDDFGAAVCEHVKALVLVGVTSDKIEKAVKEAKNYNDLPIYRCSEFKEAVEKARDISKDGDTVILSPACASFDLFKNFEERGNTFKQIVNEF